MTPVEHAVELALDEAAAAACEALMARLAAAGVAPLGDLAPHVHPHVSLAVCRGATPAAIAAACRGVADHLPLELSLSSVGVFVSPARVAYLGVTPTEALLAANREAHRGLAAAAIATRELYRPGSFVPHVTLAMHVARLDVAVDALADAPLPLVAVAARAGVVEVPTGRRVATIGD